MLSNEQMKEGRYLKAANIRRTWKQIESTLAANGTVTIATYTQVKHYQGKHTSMFRCTDNGIYVQRGKKWDCIFDGYFGPAIVCH